MALFKRLKGLLAGVIILTLFAGGCGRASRVDITSSGTVESTEINVSAETGGKITDILVREGGTVKQGDVLARVDSTIQALQVQQAEAALRAAQEKAKETKAGSRQQLVAQAQAAVRQMTSLQKGAGESMNNARENLERIRALFNEGGATSQQLSDAQTRYETAKAQYDAYSAQMASAQEQLDLLLSGATSETMNIADAGVAQAQANLSIAKAQLAKTVIKAPVGGIISSLNFDQGEVVAPGAAVASLVDTRDLWVNVYVSEKELARVKLGQKAEVYVDAYPGKPFPGEVSYISSKAEFTPKNLQTKEERVNMVFAVKVIIKDGNDRLKPGIPADINIITQ